MRKYPRPQLRRPEWVNLNGKWNFEFDSNNIGTEERWFENPRFSKTILVPFPYQSELSTIHVSDAVDVVWYHRTFTVETHKQVILHFGAVDYECFIYLNGQYVGTHIGGSNSFSFDITDYLVPNAQNLVVKVVDPSYNAYISRGKQTWKQGPFEVFYERTTGIWQTVWLEFVHKHAITKIKTTPLFDDKTFQIELFTDTCTEKEVEITISYKNNLVGEHKLFLQDLAKAVIPVSEVYCWTPETPSLYDIFVKVFVKGEIVDEIKSYSALRKYSIKGNQVLLNDEPYYLRLVLDQGYYKEGLLSYPTEEDLIEDIKLAKQMGFNGARKHQKIEAERYLYYADTLGFLVSLEMPSAYKYSFSTHFINEWINAVERDYNYVSLFMYVPFNESWGIRNVYHDKQIETYVNGVYYLTKSLDSSRIISSNDGWEQPVSDICAIHTYRHGKIDDKVRQEEYYKSITNLDTLLSSIHTDGTRSIYLQGYHYNDQPIILSEFGGISFADRHQVGWGYTGVDSKEDYEKELTRLFDTIYESKHLSGFCYTQLTDVEQEINGLLDYDRNPKLPLQKLNKIINR